MEQLAEILVVTLSDAEGMHEEGRRGSIDPLTAADAEDDSKVAQLQAPTVAGIQAPYRRHPGERTLDLTYRINKLLSKHKVYTK